MNRNRNSPADLDTYCHLFRNIKVFTFVVVKKYSPCNLCSIKIKLCPFLKCSFNQSLIVSHYLKNKTSNHIFCFDQS